MWTMIAMIGKAEGFHCLQLRVEDSHSLLWVLSSRCLPLIILQPIQIIC